MTEADGSMSRERLRAQLKRDEGTGRVKDGRLMPYVDTVGKVTIGWGRNLTDRGISYAEAEELLDNDIDIAIRECIAKFHWFPALDPVRQAVIVNMCFNLGMSRLLKFPNTLQSIATGKYEEAAIQMLQSKWADQVGARALRLAEQMRSGAWQ